MKPQFIQDVTDPRGNVHSVLIYGKGDLRLGNMTFATMREVKDFIMRQYPREDGDEGFSCGHCGADNVAGATMCCGCGEPRGSHPNDPEPPRPPAQKIRKSLNGKLHLSGGLSAANCSSGNRGMRFEGRVPAKAALSFPRASFCKKCFGSDPYTSIIRMSEGGYLE